MQGIGQCIAHLLIANNARGTCTAAGFHQKFSPGRLTDHRINLTLYKLAFVMEGDLDEVIDALLLARKAEQLEELELGARG